MAQSSGNLIWIDLEMTGLDTDSDSIIEIATVVTDSQLSIVAEGPVVAIYQQDSVLNKMDDWNTNQHSQSGLLYRVRKSNYSREDAEARTLNFLEQYVPKNKSPMCGNSICQDRRFLYREMPALEEYFHYRNLDVSTIKELVKRWSNENNQFLKHSSHLALDDIKDSIVELQHYREKYFKF